MPDRSHVHVRKMEVGDFDFVRTLAAQQSNFTVPPPYVLWLLLRIKGAITLIAEDSDLGPVSYLLAVPVESPDRCLYVWQLATSDQGKRSDATLAIIRKFREIAIAGKVRVIAFSAVPESPAYRAIRQYIRGVFSSVPQPITRLPSLIDLSENEFRLDVESP